MEVLAKAGIIFDKILNALAWLAGVMVIFMTLAVSYSVVLRYLFARPPIWVVQISEYMLLWITFLGTAWLLREKGHIKVDIINKHLSERSQTILNIITSTIGALVCLVIFLFGVLDTWNCFWTKVIEAKTLYIPKAPIIAIIAIGSFLLLIQFVRDIYTYSIEKLNRRGKP